MTPRCHEVLFLIHTERASTKDIAARMRLAPNTVQTYIEQLREITSCYTIEQLAAIAPEYLWPDGPPHASD